MTDYYGNGYGGYESITEVVTPPTPIPLGETPGLRVLIDFVHDINPDADVMPAWTWTDVTSSVRSPQGFTITRGRQRSLDRNEAGTATLVLDNFEREFDPDNTDGPHYPGVAPMRAVRVEAVTQRDTQAFTMASSEVGGTDLVGGGASRVYTALYHGFIEGWTFDYPERGFDATATARCVDMLGIFAREDTSFDGANPPWVSVTIDEDPSSATFGFIINVETAPTDATSGHGMAAAITAILNTRAYTGRGPVTIDTDPITGQVRYLYGTSTMRDISTDNGYDFWAMLPGTNMLDSLAKSAASEGGNFFVARDGTIVYRDRLWLERPVDDDLLFATDAERYVDVSQAFDETRVFNDVTVSTAYGADETVTDEASQNQYLTKSYSLDTFLSEPADATTRAQDMLTRLRAPQTYLARLDLSNVVADWEAIMSRDLWDIVTVDVALPGGEHIVQRSQIEGIEIASAHRDNWQIAWWLSVPGFPNLFTPEESSFEADEAGWTAETNCTVASTDTDANGHAMSAPDGVRTLAMTAASDADMSCLSPVLDVEARRSYLATIDARMLSVGGFGGTPAKTSHIEIRWLDASDVELSTAVGTSVDVGAAWTYLSVAGRAPAGAVTAQLRVTVEDAETTQPAYLDLASIARSS